MRKYFKEVHTIEELRKEYRSLLKKYHPDTPTGNVETMQAINTEYDFLFSVLRDDTDSSEEFTNKEANAENEAFKRIINSISNISDEVEIIGSWIWVHNGFEYKELLKSVGFKYAPQKKCWCWHYGDYKRYHKNEISLDDIRAKYGSTRVRSRRKAIS